MHSAIADRHILSADQEQSLPAWDQSAFDQNFRAERQKGVNQSASH